MKGEIFLSKSKEKIRVSFKSSGAAEDVTGSCTVISWGKPKKTILIDCGLVQGNQSLLKEYQINNSRFSFKEKEVEYIFVTHAHCDHQGRIPLLVKRGFNGKIIVPKNNKKIIKELQLDSAKIMLRDALDLSKRMKVDYFPIYTEKDVKKTYDLLEEYDFNHKYILDEDISFEFIPAGHVLGSAQLILYIKNGNSTKKLAFTGDLGNLSVPSLYTEKFVPINNCNLLVGECTYANKDKSIKSKDRIKDLEKIKSIVYDTIIDGEGSILFPVFSFQRSQVMATILYEIFKEDKNFNGKIVMGSPLTCKINKIFNEILEADDLKKWEEVLNWEKIQIVDNYEIIEELLRSKQQTIFLCSAGMLNSGFAVGIAEKLLPSSKNAIVFCGYSVEGTLSWKIKQKKQKTITINGKQISNRCNVVNLHSFSSHAQRETLLDYYSGGMGNGLFGKIALNHGNFKDKCVFGKELQELIEKRNRTDKVVIVNKSTEITL